MFYFFELEDVVEWSFILLLPKGLVEVTVFVSVFGLGCRQVVEIVQAAIHKTALQNQSEWKKPLGSPAIQPQGNKC